ncbi:MAG: hypothetical protein AUJ32_00420 [Parcubacteria group bacterium CG1_02_40_82]|uniref:Rod shape-determining protein MreD n=1 Tax=Candidatus Portnoybacteria bacterium CG_4_9_14_3_um_filter_40_10 TaxID=1974804 RepID=A0A2M7YMP5_9BACT|nr:MAG: hypothetical protein AUJ32_00420 [Parcubacteria group bacterium CG1_02_40_82]PIS31906.1 MAG: hypothetical protein COT41_00450 [Candidatus Portnoybacteria bacterium CG08_land_8_20_14_0_20_40_83]PJA64240.1 MAG: hypothetical protein CO159_04145 [Candidatus Portnoybacteria bacterium CG_4_9_14_3_um_filter_40_10]
MSNKTKILIIVLIILLAAASRLVKHPFNFTPIAAMALFSGCYLRKKWGIFLPLAAMLVSDYFIGFYDWQVMASVYVSIALAFFIGWFLSRRLKWYNVIFASLVSSVVFFLVTNFAVWAFFSWYPHTLAGLFNCFTLALPFFRNTLLGDLVYSGVLFGAYELVLWYFAKRTLSEAKI